MDKVKSSNKDFMEWLKLGLVLVVITAVVAVIMAYINTSTKDIIAKNNMIKQEDLEYVMAGADDVSPYGGTMPGEDSSIKEIYEAKAGGSVMGYVYKVSVQGYKDMVDVLVGIKADGNLGAAKVTKLAETPGLGALVQEPKFIDQYTGKPIAESFKVVKAAPANPNEIESVSGATISSNAVTTAINDAVNHYKTEIKGEAVVEEPKAEPTIENMLLDGDAMEEMTGDLKTLKVTKAGAVTGYIVYGEGKGYYDTPIIVAVGFDLATKKITNIMVTEQNETQGLGTAITDVEFSEMFQGKDAQAQKIEVYSGASVSSEGAIKAINAAITYFNDVLAK
jgi:electron transport complex protein RnfG